jgi:dolichol kinase
VYYLAIAGITALPLTLGEFSTRLLGLKGEGARKFVHVLGGVAAVVLGLFYQLGDVTIVVATFVVIMLPVRIFLYQEVKSLYAVSRRSYGEVLFPAGVALAAAIAPSTNQYLAAMLMLGFSDTAAALVGQHFPWGAYRVFSHQKTITGSLAFAASAATACCITGLPFATALAVVCAGTAVEAVGINGTDNLLVPVVAALV